MTDTAGPEGAVPDLTQSPSQGPPLTERPCLNCGDPVHGNYCRMCGQRKAEHRASVRRLLADALQDQFSLTSELPRTFKALAFHPGFLTAEYARGRIASYIPPFRVYLVTSIVFFLLLSLEASGHNPLSTDGNSNFNVTLTSDSTAGGAGARDPVARDSAGVDSAAADSGGAAGDTAGAATRQYRGPMLYTPFAGVNKKLRAKAEIIDKDPDEFQKRLTDYLIRRTPTTMFILLPVFALLMKLFYWRTGRYYAEHFIYSLHTHAFAFLIFTGLALLPDKGVFDIVGKVLFGWLMIYPLLAMKRVYGQRWAITFAKYLMVGLVYMMVFSLAMYVQTVTALLLI